MELGYWAIKGIAEPQRLLLNYVNLKYDEYNPASWEAWFAKKFKMNTNFPNLPYLKNGDLVVTESSAIPFYIIQQANRPELFGKSEADKIQEQILLGVLTEIRILLSKFVSSEDYNKVYETNKAKIRAKFEGFSKTLADKDFLLGYITYADLYLFVILDAYKIYEDALKEPTALDTHKNLKGLRDRVKNLPELQAYFKSGAYNREHFPIFMDKILGPK